MDWAAKRIPSPSLRPGGLGVSDQSGHPLAEGPGDGGVGGQDAVELVEGHVDERPRVADFEAAPAVLRADLLPVLAKVVGGGERCSGGGDALTEVVDAAVDLGEGHAVLGVGDDGDDAADSLGGDDGEQGDGLSGTGGADEQVGDGAHLRVVQRDSADAAVGALTECDGSVLGHGEVFECRLTDSEQRVLVVDGDDAVSQTIGLDHDEAGVLLQCAGDPLLVEDDELVFGGLDAQRDPVLLDPVAAQDQARGRAAVPSELHVPEAVHRVGVLLGERVEGGAGGQELPAGPGAVDELELDGAGRRVEHGGERGLVEVGDCFALLGDDDPPEVLQSPPNVSQGRTFHSPADQPISPPDGG